MLFAAILVGGQVLLIYAMVPSAWLIEDEKLRRLVTTRVTRRFAWLAAVSIWGLVVTGLFQFYQDELVSPDIRENMMDFRFGAVFVTKMTLLVVLIAVHGIYFGRRIGRTSEAVAAGEAEPGELERLRRDSLYLLRGAPARLDRADLPGGHPRQRRLHRPADLVGPRAA